MAVLFDTFQGTEVGNSTTATVTIVPPTTPDRIAIAMMHCDPNADLANNFVSWGSTATASDSFTEIGTISLHRRGMALFYLLNPDTASHNVKFEFEDTDGPTVMYCTVAIYTGVHQTSPILDSTLALISTASTESILTLVAESGGLIVSGVNRADTAGHFTFGDTQITVYNDTSLLNIVAAQTYKSPGSTAETVTAFLDTIPTVGAAHGAVSLAASAISVAVTGAISSISGTIVKDVALVRTGAISSISGTIVKAITKAYTGAISSITGSILVTYLKSLTGSIAPTGAFFTERLRVFGRIVAIIAPIASMLGITAPATDVSAKTAPAIGVQGPTAPATDVSSQTAPPAVTEE